MESIDYTFSLVMDFTGHRNGYNDEGTENTFNGKSSSGH